jgi:hypothetical protein
MTLPPYEWPTRMAGLLTRPSVRGDIAFGSVEAVLGGHDLVPLRLKRGDHLAKA